MPPSALAKPALSLLVDSSGRRLPLSVTVRRSDAWEDETTGFGTRRDKTTYGSFFANRVLSAEELSDLYHHSDMPRRVVDLLPTEALREPFEVDCGDEALNELVEERLEQIGCRPALLDGWCFGRLYGGCGVILGADDGRLASMPLVPERARSLEYLHVVEGEGAVDGRRRARSGPEATAVAPADSRARRGRGGRARRGPQARRVVTSACA